jgi:hypothetical protein
MLDFVLQFYQKLPLNLSNCNFTKFFHRYFLGLNVNLFKFIIKYR